MTPIPKWGRKRSANELSVELVMPFHNFLSEVSDRHTTTVTSLRKPNRTALFWNLSILERYLS